MSDFNISDDVSEINLIWYVFEGYYSYPQYFLYLNEELIDSGTWEIGVPILASIGNLNTGRYVFHIEIRNKFEIVYDFVAVKVDTSFSDIPAIPGYPIYIFLLILIMANLFTIKSVISKNYKFNKNPKENS